MVCSSCGKQLEEGSRFCTECGTRCGNTVETGDQVNTRNRGLEENKALKKINAVIETSGEDKINKYLSVISIVSMLAIRVFGFVFTSLIVTAVNGYLIYYNYKKTSKINTKIIAWSIAVFLTGILIWLQTRLMFI